MNKTLAGLGVLGVLCSSSLALDRNAFSFQRYELEFRIDPAGQATSARGKITLRNESKEPQTELALQISSSLEWRLIQFATAGKPPLRFIIQPYTSDIDHTGKLTEAVVTLPVAVAPHESLELEIGYSGTIPPDTTRLTRLGTSEDAARRTDWDQVSRTFTAVRGAGYVVWYPVAMEAASLEDGSMFARMAEWKRREARATMQARFCWIADIEEESQASPQLTVLANGRLEGMGRENLRARGEQEASAATGCASYRFTALGEVVPTFVIGRFDVLQRPALNIYHLPGRNQIAADNALAAEKMLPLVTEWFGPPRQKVQLIELDQPDANPYESGPLWFAPLRQQPSRMLEIQMAHLLVHAAFPSPRPWIYEGLAHFAQALVREQQAGRNAALEHLATYLPALLQAEKESGGQDLLNSVDELYLRAKAAYVWWMLRDMLGDNVLQQMLKSYRAPEDTRPSYLQQLIESRTRRDLEWFFDDWVYRDRGLPDFNVEAVFPRQLLGGHWLVTVTLENLGKAGAEVPVRLRMETGEVMKRLEVRAGSKAVTRIEMPSRPVEVIVNDGSVPEADVSNNRFPVKNPENP